MKHKRKVDQGIDDVVDAAAPRLHLATGLEASTSSPARQMQSDLDRAFSDEAKWPPRMTLSFILATCGAFWAVVFLALKVLFG
ncbi:hypothetical protein ABOZ73_06750 [Caulobacter sp. 73W]|uniref:Uncharacterized protein n=1 Tax=Caulobacter sp. 73W TaxID=3161137 RepID=A0AB39KWS1_9CAUL